ncbi:MAG: phage tail tape measure protein [Acutalibacteraceae bacterium]
MTNSFKNADGAAQDMADNMLNNLSGDVENMSGAFESAGINLASQFTPEIRSITQAVTNAIDKFNGLSDSQQKTIAVIAISGGLYRAATPWRRENYWYSRKCNIRHSRDQERRVRTWLGQQDLQLLPER